MKTLYRKLIDTEKINERIKNKFYDFKEDIDEFKEISGFFNTISKSSA